MIYTEEQIAKIWEEQEELRENLKNKTYFTLEAYIEPDIDEFEDEDDFDDYIDECPPILKYKVYDISMDELDSIIDSIDIEFIEDNFATLDRCAINGFSTRELTEDNLDACFNALTQLIESKL